MKLQPHVAALTVLLLLAPACRQSESKVAAGGGGVPGGGGLTLNVSDFPSTSPCPNQAILTDAGMFATFQAALLGGTFLYRDVPFNGADPNIYRKKCGLGTFFNPASSVNEIAPAQLPVTIANLITGGNAGICAAGFNNGSFGTGEGFPVAGTYRKEFKVSHMGTTYLVRTRVSVTGSAAGATFASRGIAVPADIQNTLGFEVDGNAELHGNVLPAIATALQANTASVMLDVLDMPGGTLLISALIEVICVEIV